ncbi:unnamed protein product [Tilletia controversa]|nr:unnamed protein product [Tilletia controversa]CAD6923854.1 unnamed protein product [Tilletia controversa]
MRASHLIILLATIVTPLMVGAIQCPRYATPGNAYCEKKCKCACDKDGNVHCDRKVLCGGDNNLVQDFCEASCSC